MEYREIHPMSAMAIPSFSEQLESTADRYDALFEYENEIFSTRGKNDVDVDELKDDFPF